MNRFKINLLFIKALESYFATNYGMLKLFIYYFYCEIYFEILINRFKIKLLFIKDLELYFATNYGMLKLFIYFQL
jgi:putative copper export protein